MTFRCAPDYYDDDDFADGAKVIVAADAEEAAKRYVDENLPDLDWPREICVRVRGSDGKVTRWDATVMSVPYVSVREAK